MQNHCPQLVSSIITEPLPEHTLTDLWKLQQEDDTVGPLLTAVEDQKYPSSSATQGTSRKFQLLLQQWKQLYVNQGLLFHRYEGIEKWAQLVIPDSLKLEY